MNYSLNTKVRTIFSAHVWIKYKYYEICYKMERIIIPVIMFLNFTQKSSYRQNAVDYRVVPYSGLWPES